MGHLLFDAIAEIERLGAEIERLDAELFDLEIERDALNGRLAEVLKDDGARLPLPPYPAP